MSPQSDGTDKDLVHHRNMTAACEGCGARWLPEDGLTSQTMEHKSDCPIIQVEDNGCHYCGGGDAVELEAGQGVSANGKAFHTECVMAWGESQGFNESELEALAEQAF